MYSKAIRKYIVISLVLGWAITFAYYSLRSKISRNTPNLTHQNESTLKNKLYREKRLAMGTFVEIISPDKRSFKIAFAEIGRIDKLLSKYNRESEISKLNYDGFIKASPETFFIVKKSIELYKNTNGAFDITIEPLMRLWGFTNKDYRIPEKEEIIKTLTLIGSEKIILDDTNQLIKFRLPGMQIDLGAIAKGYALDCAVKKLRAAGITSCLINAGGQIYCLGECFSKPWSIGIRSPNKRIIAGSLKLKDKSVSTSGSYEQYFLKGNRRYGHILNPKTGYPADTDISSITVIAEDGLTADALSTAIFVLGKREGMKISSQFKDVQIKIIDIDNVQNN